MGPPAAPRQARGEALATGTRKAASGRGVSSPSRARERQFLSKRMSSLGLKRFCWRASRCRWRMLESSRGRGRRQGSCWGEVTAPGMVLGTEEWGARGSGLAAQDRDAAGGVVLGGYVATRFPLDSPGQFVRPQRAPTGPLTSSKDPSSSFVTGGVAAGAGASRSPALQSGVFSGAVSAALHPTTPSARNPDLSPCLPGKWMRRFGGGGAGLGEKRNIRPHSASSVRACVCPQRLPPRPPHSGSYFLPRQPPAPHPGCRELP